MSMTGNVFAIRARIVLIGDTAVGKTSILNRVMEDRFNPFEQTTVGANWQLYVRDFNGDRVELQIWDTAGQERFRSLGPLYYRGASGAIVVYDVTSRSSLESLAHWIEDFEAVAGNDGMMVIAGNKCDLEDQRQVSQKEALDWAKGKGYLAYETSAKSGQNVRQMIDALAEAVLRSKGGDKGDAPTRLAEGGGGGGCC
jgi:small GTP-binding protein